MVFTTAGQSGVQRAIGDLSSNRPQFMGIGSGSGATNSSDNVLVHEVGSRRAPTAVDLSTANQIAYAVDWNSVEMSGIDLREIGMFEVSGTTTGSLFNREGFAPVTFDGTNELQVQLNYEVY